MALLLFGFPAQAMLVDPFDDVGSNDTFATTTPISLPFTLHAAIDPQFDQDFFKFEVTNWPMTAPSILITNAISPIQIQLLRFDNLGILRKLADDLDSITQVDFGGVGSVGVRRLFHSSGSRQSYWSGVGLRLAGFRSRRSSTRYGVVVCFRPWSIRLAETQIHMNQITNAGGKPGPVPGFTFIRLSVVG